ncbi:MAG: FKBP-type peptidyl-prolyl cis-trans isomerase [Candidatus Pacebacteria bacterium]|nr:FKBP-type peptidyl-prolyl cis-trans isomerase [Candidatus Paceibacterota bacterium]MDD4074107.1 FKBP-type peptidyl-prolyl cis-trans isomerase [Candidatus Paceibacterota bacterium]
MKKSLLLIIIFVIVGSVCFFLNSNKEEDFLAKQNEDKEMVKIEIKTEGTGEVSKSGDVLTVHYIGTLENGTKFDSSVDRGIPFSFTLGVGQVIQGWEEGMSGMKIGEKRKLIISPEKGYGERGVPGVIPSNATLIFEVELLGIN